MAARVNTRFVIILASVVVLLALGFGGTAFYMVKKDPSANLARGDAAMTESRFEDAMDQYGRAYSKRPSDPTIINKLVKAIEKAPVKDSRDALDGFQRLRALLDRLTTLDPKNPEYFERLMTFYLRIGRDQHALELFNIMMERSEQFLAFDKENILGRKFRGIAQVNRMLGLDIVETDRENARADLVAALAQLPDDADVIYHLGLWNLIEAKALDRAGLNTQKSRQYKVQLRELAQQLVKDHPQDLVRLMDRLRLIIEVGDLQQAQPELEKAMAMAKEKGASSAQISELAMMLVGADRTPIDRGPGLPASTIGLQRAVSLLEAAIKNNPDNVRLLYQLAVSYLMEQALDQAYDMVEKAIAVKVYGPALDALDVVRYQTQARLKRCDIVLQKIEMQKGAEEKAKLAAEVERMIEEVAPITGVDASEIHMLKGKLAITQAKWALATQHIDQASALKKDQDLEVLLLSARVRAFAGETGAALSRLRAILEQHPNYLPGQVFMVQILIQNRQFTEAQALAERLLAVVPNDQRLLQMHAMLQAQGGNYGKALDVYAKIDLDAHPEMINQVVNLYMAANRKADALKVVQPRLEKNPADLRLLQLMLRLTDKPEEIKDMLGKARAAGAPTEAIDFLEKTSGKDVDLMQAMEEYIQKSGKDPFKQAMQLFVLYSQRGRGDDADKELEKAAQLKPDDAVVANAQFERALARKDWSKAKELADKMGAQNLDYADGVFYRGRIALAQGENEEAQQLFRKGLGVRTTYSDGWRMLGDAQRAQGNLGECVASYRNALDQMPNNLQALTGLALTAHQQNDYQTAMETLRRAYELAPTDPSIQRMYLVFEEQYGDLQRALDIRKQLALDQPENFDNLRYVAIMQAKTNQYEGAKKTMERVIAQEGHTPRNLAALVAIAQNAGKVEDARKLLVERIRTQGEKVTVEEWLVLANFHMSQGEGQDALYAFNKAIEIEDPATRPASRELADLLFERGALSNALPYYQKLYEGNPADKRVTHRYAEALIRSGNYDLADSVLQKSLTPQAKPDPTHYVLEGLIARGRNQDERAMAAYQRAIELQPTQAILHYQYAEYLALRPDRIKEAVEAANKAIELNKTMALPYILLARIRLEQSDPQEAIRNLQTVLKFEPRNLNARTMLTRIYEQNDMLEPMRMLLADSVKLFPRDANWLRMQGNMALREKNFIYAQQRFAEAVRLTPSVENLVDFTLFYVRMQQYEQALGILDEYGTTLAESALLQGIQGRCYAELKRDDQARQIFQQAFKLAQNYPQVQFVNEQMHSVWGYPRAIAFIEPLALAAEGTMAHWYELALAADMVGDTQYEKVAARLENLELLVKPDTAERNVLNRLKAITYHNTGQFEKAHVLYEKVLASDPRNPEILNNLAYLLAEHLNRAKDGLEYAEQANKIVTNNPQILDTLGWAQFRAGLALDADKTLRRSLEFAELPANNYHMAEVLLARGERSDAIPYLEKAVQLAEKFKDREVLQAARERLADLKG